MKKFDPEKELSKVQNNKHSYVNASKLSNMYIPILVIACGVLSIVGITFSANLVSDDRTSYKVRIDIIGGDEETFTRNVLEGAYSATVPTNGAMGEINCSSGSLNFDPLTSTISSPYVNQDTNCIITLNETNKKIAVDSLYSISDGDGISYYYKADATNNYVKINDMLFRIVRVNGDGTLRLMYSDVVLSTNYGSFNEYLDSDLEKVLNTWFDETFNGESYLVEGEFDYLNDIDLELDHLLNINGYILAKVGTLSAREATIISEGVTSNYLNTVNGFLLMNPNGTDNVWAFRNGKVISVSRNDTLSVRPVINVKANIVEGNGTQGNPYLIEED